MKIFTKIFKKNKNTCVESSNNSPKLDELDISIKLSEIKRVIKENKNIISDLFSVKNNDVYGFRKIFIFFPELLQCQETVPSYLKNLILNEQDLPIDDYDFESWVVQFHDRISLYLLRKGINIDEDFQNTLFNEVAQMADLDLWYLRNKIASPHFDYYLMKKIPIDRGKKIFSNEELHERSKYPKDNLEDISDYQIKYFLNVFETVKNEENFFMLKTKKKWFFYNFLDCADREYVKKWMSEKTAFELCYIMLELNEEYFYKMLKFIPHPQYQKVINLISDKKIVIKDAKFLSKFIKEIEKEYYCGNFSMSHS